MGLIYAEILLISGEDIACARHHIIGEEEIRQAYVNMLVDSGSVMMCINESIQEILNLPFVKKRRYQQVEGVTSELDIVGPVKVRFQNRDTICNAVVLPGNSEPLLGAIPMEEMDVLIDPKRQELIVNPDYPQGRLQRI